MSETVHIEMDMKLIVRAALYGLCRWESGEWVATPLGNRVFSDYLRGLSK